MAQMQKELAHTAEHAFIGSLQKLIGKTLNVRKVEHRDYENLVVIASTSLDVDTVIKAEQEVNRLISQGRKLTTHSFSSLAEAKTRLPHLRANENRIASNKEVRVVEIENHDMAACIMDHATNLRECGLFLITSVNKRGSDCEIRFVVADAAKNAAIDFSRKILNICTLTGANYNTLDETVRKLMQSNALHFQKSKTLTQQLLDKIDSKPIHNSGPRIISGSFVGLSDVEVMEIVSRKITVDPNLVVIIANLKSDLDSMANIVFARSESLLKIDCDKMFREIASERGKGGGKPNFVTGVLRKENIKEFMYTIEKTLTEDIVRN